MKKMIGMAFAGLAMTGSPALIAQEQERLGEGPNRAEAILDAPVRLQAGDEYIDTGKSIAHSGPMFHDLDRDGRPDLLVGNFKGNFQHYRNIGTRQAPEFEALGLLQADGKPAFVKNW